MYGASAGRYFELVGGALSDEVETRADLELLARFVRAARATGDRALDAGCGTGRAGRLLADHGFDTVGVDIADGMVEIADREHPDLNFIVAQLDRLPFARSRFSTVVCWYSIITTPPDEIIGAFGELHRVLIDGGVRRGVDIVRARVLGARAVLIGRPVLWGLAVGGRDGVARILGMLRKEFDTALALCGAGAPHELTRDLVRRRTNER